MKPLHERSRFNLVDKYLISGGDPDGCGGGLIGTAQTMIAARELQAEAVKAGYIGVRIQSYYEFYRG